MSTEVAVAEEESTVVAVVATTEAKTKGTSTRTAINKETTKTAMSTVSTKAATKSQKAL